MRDKKFDVVSFCRGSKCCPEGRFFEDGSVELVDGDQRVLFSKDAFDLLMEEARRRGK